MNKLSVFAALAAFFLMSSCQKDSGSTLVTGSDRVIIRSENSKTLTLKGYAKDSLLLLISEHDLNKDNIWFSIEMFDDRVVPPLPPWFDGDNLSVDSLKKEEGYLGEYCAIFASDSPTAKKRFRYLHAQSYPPEHANIGYLETRWSFVLSVNINGDRVLGVE